MLMKAKTHRKSLVFMSCSIIPFHSSMPVNSPQSENLTIKRGICLYVRIMHVCMYACMYVCMHVLCIFQEPFIRSTPHLVGVLLRTQGRAVSNLVQLGHATSSILIDFE